MGEQGLYDELEESGFKNIIDLRQDEIDGMTEVDFEEFKPDEGVKAVLVSFCGKFDYRKLCILSLYLQ